MGKTKTAVIGEGFEEPKKSKKKDKKKQTRTPGLKGGERVVTIGSEPTELTGRDKKKEDKKTQEKTQRTPKSRGKKYIDVATKIDRNKLYKIAEAVSLIKTISYTKFDSTLELHLVVKKKGLSINATLPHSTGKQKKVEIADEKTIKKIESGKIDFDILLATADMMPHLVPHAKILGPKGLMPNPKKGTIIKDKSQAKKFGGNSVTIKTEKIAPIIHTSVGKTSQKEKELVENAEAILSAIGEKQVKKAYLCATMTPSVKLLVN